MPSFVRDNQNRSSAISSRRAQIRATTADEANMSIEAVLSTEQAVPMFSRQTWEIVDEILLASGRTTADHVVLLDAHDRSSVSMVLGHLENIRTEDTSNNTLCLMLFDADDPDAVRAFRKYAGGHVRDLSVGYQVLAYQIVEAGQSATIDGRTFTASSGRRLHIATSWRVDEGSCVPIGADNKAKARGDDSNNMTVQVSEEEIPALISKREKQSVSDVETESQNPAGDGTKERTVVMTTSVTVADETRQTPDELMALGAQREAKRRSDIRALATGVSPEAVTAAVDDVTCTIDKARELFLKDLQAQRSAPPAGSDAPNIVLSGNRSERDCNEASLAIALASRMGANVAQHGSRISFDAFTGQTKFERGEARNKAVNDEFQRNLERADKFKNMHTVDICREALRISGIDHVGFDRHELVTRAISTPALSAIFTNAGASVLITELEQYEDSTLSWTREIDVPNYQENTLVRVDGGRLKKRNKGQKAQHSTIAATGEVVRVGHYANQLVLDVVDLVDDAIGALAAAMSEYAVGVADLRPSLVYGFLATNAALRTDSVTLFHADHNNTATSTALTAANLQTVLGKLGGQKDAAGTVLNLTSCVIVTGTGYSFVADQLANSAEIRETAAANGTKNPFLKHGLGTAKDARLSAGFTDPATDLAVAGAPTLWYLAAKGGRHGVNVAFLNGSGRMPRMTTTVLKGNGEYGLSIDIDHSIGCGTSGFQGLQKAVG